ncbi:hypothetical protein TNCV_3188671 [Trichonephila clavipes]|nr:hypothetical protein TNCV_3188671 [Trichonephila clavipes]
MFRTYLDPLPVKVITDHATLTKFTNGKSFSSRMVRWTLKLPVQFGMETRPGTHFVEADLLSRNTFVLDESRSFFRVHTGYFSNIPKCIKAEFIASWACSQSSVVSSSKR